MMFTARSSTQRGLQKAVVAPARLQQSGCPVLRRRVAAGAAQNEVKDEFPKSQEEAVRCTCSHCTRRACWAHVHGRPNNGGTSRLMWFGCCAGTPSGCSAGR